MSDFAKYLALQLPKFGNKRRMAAAIGVSPTRLSRALNVADYPFDVGNCLRLALAAELPPGEVLRKAGKRDIAELIERLYGPGVDALTESQRTVVGLWDGIADAEARTAVLFTLRRLVTSGVPSPPGGEPREAESRRAATGKKARAARRARGRSAE